MVGGIGSSGNCSPACKFAGGEGGVVRIAGGTGRDGMVSAARKFAGSEGGEARIGGATGRGEMTRHNAAGHGVGPLASTAEGRKYAALGRGTCSTRAHTTARSNETLPRVEAPRVKATVMKKFGAPCVIKP